MYLPQFKDKNKMYIINQYGAGGISRDGLIGEYLFESNVNDTSGIGNHGTASVITYVNDRKAVANSAASFNGSSSHVQVANNPFYFPSNTPFSFSFWYQLLTAQTGNDYIISSGRNTVGSINYLIGYLSATDVFWLVNNDSAGTNFCIAYPTSPDRDAWHHIVYSFDGSNMSAYKDNVLIISKAFVFGTVTSDSDKFFLGRDNWGGNRFLGYLDELRIYNRALTISEIASLYNE